MLYRGLAARVSLLTALLVATPCRASAEVPPTTGGGSPAAYPPVELGLGGGSSLTGGLTCTRIESDVEGCQSVNMVHGLHLAPQYRLLEHWSLGVRGDVAWAASAGTSSTKWWMARAEGRWHLLGHSEPDLWMGLDAGVVAIAQSFQADELGPAGAETKVAPILGAGIGVDWVLGSRVALGPSLRTFVIPLPGNAEWLLARGTSYTTQFGASLELNVTLLFGGGG
jgi:hypothetical protein